MLRLFFKKFIRFYQRWISPMFFPSCRFYPTCSEYSHQALDRYPLVKAGSLIILRLLKCHPFHNGGCDPLK